MRDIRAMLRALRGFVVNLFFVSISTSDVEIGAQAVAAARGCRSCRRSFARGIEQLDGGVAVARLLIEHLAATAIWSLRRQHA